MSVDRRSPVAVAAVVVATVVLLLGCAATPTERASTSGPQPRSEVVGATETAAGDEPRFEPVALKLLLDDEVLRDLYTRDPFDDDRVDGVMVALDSGEQLALDGLRFRGSSSRLMPKKSFNVRFEQPQPFLHGSNRMNLKAMFTDPTFMREVLAWEMFHELGRPAPRTTYVDLWINGTYEGLYVHVERVDEHLLGDAGLDPDGTLVRDGFRDDLSLPWSAFGLHPLPPAAIEPLLPDRFGSRGEPDWSAVADLIAWGTTVEPGAALAAELGDRFDLEVLIDWLAIHALVGDVDSFGDDYWLHLGTGPGDRWVVIPWDKDLAFGRHTRDGVVLNEHFSYRSSIEAAALTWHNGLLMKILGTPALAERLDRRILELMDEPFTADWFDERIEAIDASIGASARRGPGPEAFVLHPANHLGMIGSYDNNVEALRDFIDLRWRYLRHQLGDERAGPQMHHPVGPDQLGRRLVFADGDGVTVAELTVQGTVGSGAVHMALEPLALPGMLQRALAVTSEVPVTGTLRLHYRFEPGEAFAGIPPDDWVSGTVSSAELPSLVVATAGPEGLEPRATRVNPYNATATADVALPAGTTMVVLATPAAAGWMPPG